MYIILRHVECEWEEYALPYYTTKIYSNIAYQQLGSNFHTNKKLKG